MEQWGGDHGFTTASRRSGRYLREVINDRDFADNIDTLGNSLQEAHNQLSKTAKAEKIVLVINTKKKEIMSGNSCKENPISNNEDIKLADDFIYLGKKDGL